MVIPFPCGSAWGHTGAEHQKQKLMTTIITTYIPSTNTRGSRIKADAGMKRTVTIPFPHSLSGEAVHLEAAKALCAKFDWHGELVAGGMEKGFAFIFTKSGKYKADRYKV